MHSHCAVIVQCFVFIQRDGERSIIMAPAATSLIDGAAIDQYFGMVDPKDFRGIS